MCVCPVNKTGSVCPFSWVSKQFVSAYVTEDEFDAVYGYATSEPRYIFVLYGSNGKMIFNRTLTTF